MKKPDSLSLQALLFLLALAIGLGSYYRFVGLESRPLHADEAILATKAAELWETGRFDYDPSDYHGPGLHYATWVYGKLAGWGAPETWTTTGLRHLAVISGMLLILSTLLLQGALTLRGAVIAMLLMAVSPMMVYYSRYYIMEMPFTLLVAASLVGYWRWTLSSHPLWLVACGVAIGLQHATKETFVLNVGAAVCGWAVSRLWVSEAAFKSSGGGIRLSSSSRKKSSLKPWHSIAIAAVVVSVILYSGFFRDWVAVKESFTTYSHYLTRAEGSGHEKPWHYYLTLIFWRKDGLVWTEAILGGLGIVGMIYSFFGDHRDGRRQSFLVFLSVYTLALFTVYSILSYKTPWSILSAQHTLTLLAGVGAAALWGAVTGGLMRFVFKVALGIGVYHLCGQSMLAIDQYKADPRNPYVYSHTSTNLLQLIHTVLELETLNPADALRVQVINRDHGWPLPWYFRNLNTVGFHDRLPKSLQADVVIAEAEHKNAVNAALFGQGAFKDTGYHGLRPGVTLIMLVRQDLWDQLMQKRAQTAPPP